MEHQLLGDGRIQLSRTGTANLPHTNYCITCDRELNNHELKSDIGPFNHIGVFPDHVVFQVTGLLEIYRGVPNGITEQPE